MKKRFISLLLCLLLLSLLRVSAFAEARLLHVTDTAGLLSAEEVQTLEAQAEQISQQYQCGLYVITVPDYKEIDGTSVYECAKAIYSYYDLGIGEEKTGMVLLLSMAERDYALAAYGMDAHIAFTDYGKDRLSEEFLAFFRENDWKGGFERYLSYSGYLLEEAAKGTPVDVGTHTEPIGFFDVLLMALPASCVIALIVCLVFCVQMKTAKKQTEAGSYVVDNSFHLSRQQDFFLRRSVTRQRIERQQSSSGGTTIDSSGFSGKSGKF